MADEEKRPDTEEAEGSASQGEAESYGASDLTLEDEPSEKAYDFVEDDTQAAFDLNAERGPGGILSKKVEEHSEHIGHVPPMSLLVGVLGALILLTILTVAVTAVDLGSQGNFIVAMVIATVKAVLVMGYFMHLFWDHKFNVVLFGSSFLFASLFLAMAYLDSQETQGARDAFSLDQALLKQE